MLFDSWWWANVGPEPDDDGGHRQRIDGHAMTPADVMAMQR